MYKYRSLYSSYHFESIYYICEVFIFASQACNAVSRKTGHVRDDVTWPPKGQGRDQNIFEA